MRHLPGLIPYALASVAVVVASAIGLGATIRGPIIGPGGPPASAEPTPAGSRASLSDVARIAYWRSTQTGQLELWVSDLDGGRRWTVATAGAGSDVALTRWAPDGSAVAHVLSGQTLVVSRLDLSTAVLDIPGELRTERWRIVSYEWSPDATRIAATLRAGNGLSNTSEVYLVNAKAGSAWERLTTLGDAFAGKWISPTQLFVEEASGAVLTIDLSSRAMRPLSGMAVTSPQIGRDGRTYFVGGLMVAGDVATQPVGSGWIWSATVDGDDLRREVRDGHDNLRLFGILADGRPVVGVPGGVYVVGDSYVALAFQAGTVRRVVVSADGKRIVGITEQRILLIDPAKVPRGSSSGAAPADSVSVLLSSVREPDAWFPAKPVTPSRSTARPPEVPAARLAFTLGRSVYQMDPNGEIRALLSEPAFLTTPRWSPLGDRLAVLTGPAGGSPTTTVSVIGPSGIKRWDLAMRTFQPPSWSADGSRLAFTTGTATAVVSGPGIEYTTQLYDADTGLPAEKMAGRAAFVAGAAIVLSDGDPDAAQNMRVGQRLDVVSATGARTITDARRLAASPLLRDLPDAGQPSVITQFVPSADGQYVAVWLYRARNSGLGTGSLVVVPASDGEPSWGLPISPQGVPFDLAWSPSDHLVAWTAITDRVGGTATRQMSVVDPTSGRTILTVEGRFGGWAPDGQWVYVARDEGLFAYPVAGGAPVRINAIGVPVASAKP